MKAKTIEKRRWANFFSYWLAAISIIAISAYTIVRWADTKVLRTEAWVSTVGPLPRDPVVAAALANYTISTLIDQNRAEARIKDALPEKADFLAGPLYDQLNTRANTLAKNFISSDKFQTIWIGANRLAISSLLNSARVDQTIAQPKKETKLKLGLDDLKNVVASRVGSVADGGGSEGISVGLKAGIGKFKTSVRAADFLNSVLPFVIIASVLGSLALARRRLKILLIIFGGSAVAGLWMLIGLNLGKSAVLGEVKRPIYKPAISKILDQLTVNLKTTITNLFIFSLVVIAIALTFHYLMPRLEHRYPGYKKTRLFKQSVVARNGINTYFRYILGGFTALVLLSLAFTSNSLQWARVLNSFLLIFAVASVLVMLRQPAIKTRAAKARRASA